MCASGPAGPQPAGRGTNRPWLRCPFTPTGSEGHSMTNDIASDSELMAAIRRERAQLVEQIETSQRTIQRSQELITRIDDLLAKSDQKP
jgi:hypothetical protein